VFQGDLLSLAHRRSVVVSALASTNVVNRHWARLLLGWVTAHGQVNRLDCNQPSIVYSAFYPLWNGKMSISFWEIWAE